MAKLRLNTSIYGAPVTLHAGPRQAHERDPISGPVAPEGQNSIGAGEFGMAQLRADIQAKTAQDWVQHPWEPLNQPDNQPGDAGDLDSGVNH